MYNLVEQLSEHLGIGEELATKITEYLNENWDEVSSSMGAGSAAPRTAGPAGGDPPQVLDDGEVPVDLPEETPGRSDDAEHWVLRQSDGC